MKNYEVFKESVWVEWLTRNTLKTFSDLGIRLLVH